MTHLFLRACRNAARRRRRCAWFWGAQRSFQAHASQTRISNGVRGGGILLGVEANSGEDVEKLETLLEDIGAEYVRTE